MGQSEQELLATCLAFLQERFPRAAEALSEELQQQAEAEAASVPEAGARDVGAGEEAASEVDPGPEASGEEPRSKSAEPAVSRCGRSAGG